MGSLPVTRGLAGWAQLGQSATRCSAAACPRSPPLSSRDNPFCKAPICGKGYHPRDEGSIPDSRWRDGCVQRGEVCNRPSRPRVLIMDTCRPGYNLGPFCCCRAPAWGRFRRGGQPFANALATRADKVACAARWPARLAAAVPRSSSAVVQKSRGGVGAAAGAAGARGLGAEAFWQQRGLSLHRRGVAVGRGSSNECPIGGASLNSGKLKKPNLEVIAGLTSSPKTRPASPQGRGSEEMW
jgi:hypothetical protein